MSRRPAPSGLGPKEQRDAMRKEQYGFANLAKEQQFRSTAQGDAKALQDRVRELTDMLEDRKSASRLLATENARLKKMVGDLQVQLLDKPTARGESAALKSMREMARQFQNREQMTSSAAEKLVTELMAQNQAAMDDMQRLADDRDGLVAELHTTREALSSASAELSAYRDELASMAEEKEGLMAEKEAAAREAAARDEQRLQAIAELEAAAEGLRQQLTERDAAAEAARVAAEAALRSQRAALEAEALLQRRAAVAEAEAQVASLQGLLLQAHESLRSLNQTEALGPGWTLTEHGRQLQQPQEQQEEQQGQKGREPEAASPLPAAAGGSRRSRRSSRAGESAAAASVAGSMAGSVAGRETFGMEEERGPGGGGVAAAPRPMGRLRSAAGSVAGSVQLGRSGDMAPEALSEAAALAAVETGEAGAVRSSRGGSVAAGSAAASVAGRRIGRPSEPGSGGGGGGGSEDGRLSQERSAQQEPGGDADGDGEAAAEAATPGRHDGGGGGGSRAMSVAGSVEMGPAGRERPASSRGRPPRSTAASVAAGEVEAEAASPGASPRSGRGGGTGPPAASAVSAAAAAASPLIPAAPCGPQGNVLELLLHDASLHPGAIGLPASDLWALLRLRLQLPPGTALGPGPGPESPEPPSLVHLALATPGSYGSGTSGQLPLLRAQRLHFPDDRRLLAAVAGGGARVVLHNLKRAVVGAFGCPRLVARAAAAGAGGRGGGGGGGGQGVVADGTVERVLVVACRDEYGSPSLDLYCMDEEGRPTRPFQPLSAAWRPQLPDTAPPPAPDEFCIDTQALHRLQADAARSSGLFDLARLRVFTGAGDGHTYQVWRLADVEARRRATFKALDRMSVEPADDPWVGAAPLATTALPLTAALSTPTLTRLELGNVRLLLGGQPVLRLYEPSDEIGTRSLACRTADAGGEKLVCMMRVTARLARDPEVSEQLLAALQPALQAGAGAPTLPPLHWLSLLGAEELVLGRLMGEMAEGVAAAASRIMATPAHDAAGAAAVEALGRQAEEAVALKERQLSEGLASCRGVAAAAVAANPAEGRLARARLRHIQHHVARTLAELTALFRQRLELYRLGAVTWHYISQEGACGEDPVARLPVTTTRPQAKALADLLQALAAALAALAPPGATAAELLAAAAAPAAPLTLLLPPPPAAAAAAAEPPPPQAAATALAIAARELEAALRAAVDAATGVAGEAGEALRRQVAAPGADDVALTEVAQSQLAVAAAPVTAALVGGLAGLCQAAVAASLVEPATATALREQLLAAAAAAAAGLPKSSTATALRLISVNGVHLVAQLAMQVTAVAAEPTAGDSGAAAAAAAAPQLRAALQSLQWLVGSLVSRAAPPPVAASPQSAAAWAKAAVRLRLALGVLCSAWSAGAVAAAGQALLLCGQRAGAVTLALEVMGREVDRVLDATKATLESLRANRAYDDVILTEIVPPLATALTSHAAAAVTACFWLAAQMILTPLLVQIHVPSTSQRLDTGSVAGGGAAAAAADGGIAADSGGSASGGSCYSSSLHVATCASFTLTTLGDVRAGGAGGPAAAAAPPPPPPPRPTEPSLAPLSHPLLSTWTPRRAVLYLDLSRLNDAAAATAAVTAADPAAASPPPAAADTAALPLLPAAVELLGWTLRHADEYYDAHFAAAATAAAAVGKTSTSASRPGSAAPSPGPSAAPTPRGPASVEGSHRGPASVAGSEAAAADAPTAAAAAAALAVDPLAALSEAKMAARMAEEADVAVLAGGRLADAGSLVKWLSQNGMLVLAASDLQVPRAAAAAPAAASVGGGDVAAAQELARTLVGLIATHHLQAAAVRALAHPAANGGGGAAAAAATPRSSVPGQGPPAAAEPQAGLKPLAVLTYLPDVALAKPALAAVGDLAHRVELTLAALTAAFAAAAPLAPHAAMLGRHVTRQLAQQRLMLEGLLTAPELLRARHPGTTPLPGSVAAAAAPAAPWQPWGRVGGVETVPVVVAATPALSRQSSLGRLRPALPAMTPKSSVGSRRSSLTGGAVGGAAAAAAGTPPRPPLSPPPPPAADAYSTESEDEEVGVSKLAAPRAAQGRPGVRTAAGGASAALPDLPDADSDAASIASASTLGSLTAQRSRVPR